MINVVVYTETGITTPDGSKLLAQLIGVNDVFTCLDIHGAPLFGIGDLIVWRNKQYKIISRQFTYEFEGQLVGIDFVVQPQVVKK